MQRLDQVYISHHFKKWDINKEEEFPRSILDCKKKYSSKIETELGNLSLLDKYYDLRMELDGKIFGEQSTGGKKEFLILKKEIEKEKELREWNWQKLDKENSHGLKVNKKDDSKENELYTEHENKKFKKEFYLKQGQEKTIFEKFCNIFNLNCFGGKNSKIHP